MKLTLKKTTRIVLISFALILWSCENDSSSSGTQIPQATNIQSAKKWFDAYEDKGENIVLMQNLDYNWNDAQLTKSEDGTETIIVPVNELKKDQGDLWEQKLYLYKLDEDRYTALLFEAYSNKNIKPESQSVDGGDFTGYITVWDLKKGFVRGAKFLNNQVVEEGVAEFSLDRNKTNRAPETGECIFSDLDDGCHNDGGDGAAIPLREVIVKGPSTGTPVIYTPRGPVTGGTTPGGYTSPGGGGGNSGGGITAPTPVKITDALIGKAKCINALLNKNGNSFVQKLLTNFTGTSKFDIRLESLEKITTTKNGITKEDNGKTSYIKGATEIKIQISTSRIEANAALEGVRVLLHEYIHADMFRKINSNNDNSEEALEFKKVFEQYENNQHSTMGILYVNSMKVALKEFYETVLKDDYTKYIAYFGEVPSDAFYEAVAWGGLRDNDVKAWTDLPDNKKASIISLANRVTVLGKTVPCPN